jgi:putative transposase
MNLTLMQLIDAQYMETPYFGYPRMTQILRRAGYMVNRKRVARLMHLMGIEAIYPRPRTTIAAAGHKIYPYLLRHLPIRHNNHVWSTDITYLPLPGGFMYLVAVMDWHSRFVLSWQLSNTLETRFCLDALELAFAFGQPEIFNSDQGSQFTAVAFTTVLLQRKVLISMDGRGRALDNIFTERLWRSVKYEEVYLHDYETPRQARQGLAAYLTFYNQKRLHQSLDYRTPAEVYLAATPSADLNATLLNC